LVAAIAHTATHEVFHTINAGSSMKKKERDYTNVITGDWVIHASCLIIAVGRRHQGDPSANAGDNYNICLNPCDP
jgi:hypothetical protein